MKAIQWMGMGLLLFFSCRENQSEDKGTRLVQVYDEVLYESDIRHLISGNESPEDSALVINAYIERWLRNQVMSYEAEKQISDMHRINELVEDYRNSLILYQYEEQLTTAMLDTIVSHEALSTYYEEHQKDFILGQSILGVMWWPNGASVPDELNASLMRDSLRNSLLASTNGGGWGKFEYFTYREMEERFPEMDLKGLSEALLTEKSNGNKMDLFVFDQLSEGELAPLAFVRDEIEKLILHRRKIQLLQRIKEEKYQIALKRNHIKYLN